MPEKDYGPGWHDVAAEMADLKRLYGSDFWVTVHQTSTRDGRWGLHVCANLKSGGAIQQGHGVYGRAYPGNGQRTMAAAMWHAMFKLRTDPSGEHVPQPEELKHEVDDLPF